MGTFLGEEVGAIDADLPLFGIQTLDQSLAQARWPFRIFGSMFAIFAFIAALYAAARLWRLTSYSLRPDEIFSLQTARLDWTGLIGAVVRDVVHPPLFYALLKVWIGLGGESEEFTA